MIRHNKTRIETTGHYYSWGAPASEAQCAWFALHGYGQLAERLIGKFKGLDPDRHFVVAPEGLSHFYWEGVNGDVVASWMTRKDRLDEIADYVSYLDKVFDTTGLARANCCKKVVLGFSQGCATAWRWLLNSRPKIDAYVMWSGWLPEDMNYLQHAEYLSGFKLIYVHGVQDKYYPDGRFELLMQRFKNAGLDPIVIHHSGGHAIDRPVLTNLVTTHL